MTEKNRLSRKNFIKSCSATLGLIGIGLPDLLANPTTEKDEFYKGFDQAGKIEASSKIRGSWVRKGIAQTGDVELHRCQIVVGKEENSAVQQAALFLADDIFKITGHKPPVNSLKQSDRVSIILSTLGDTVPKGIKVAGLKNKREAFQIFTSGDSVWLAGADFRGTAFAAYTLSERIGIDPLYLWTGYEPLKNASLTLKKTDYFADSPTVKYRGFFHDDEDVLPRPFDKYGFPLRIGDVPLVWYQRFFETALRLRMNMVAPYVRVHRRYEVQKCASDWGLFFTSHHYDILLSNPFGIERFHLAERRGVTTSWDWFSNKENMIRYWRGGVEENKDVHAVWPVGLRGTDDHAYKFPKGTSEKEQAKVFKDAIDAQVKTVKDLVPSSEKPAFHFTLYTEMLEKYRKHPEDFKVPEDVILVWPDNNDGVMRDLPAEKDKWKHGVYYHLAYFGGPPTKQGTHVITPMRVAGQFKRIVDAGATEFMLVNVSELREHVMEARMIADICWDAKTFFDKPKPDVAYINWWIHEYFDANIADAIFNAYHDYYKLINGSEKTYFGAEQFELILQQLHQRLTKKTIKKLDQEKIEELTRRAKQYDLAFENISFILSKLKREQKQFFFEHVAFGLRVDQRPTEAALILLKAMAEPDDSKAWDLIAEAIVPLEKLELEISRAERPPFDKWYISTWIRTPVSPLNIHRSYTQLREFITTNGAKTPVKPKMTFGHNIEGAKLWSKFLEDAEQVKATY
ncbi:glycosyl hydrolase 115 family protein [Desertivirga xinjiangensis]|uniref:glycosyl hydrolase 115 family protein n=1 Tax=Desertivirga xinjiangensis TaxID=539206 RepID=UPI002109208F|nr:glycosyl hydrolase 115 family protein [Pedobacter xinjiangensis]